MIHFQTTDTSWRHGCSGRWWGRSQTQFGWEVPRRLIAPGPRHHGKPQHHQHPCPQAVTAPTSAQAPEGGSRRKGWRQAQSCWGEGSRRVTAGAGGSSRGMAPAAPAGEGAQPPGDRTLAGEGAPRTDCMGPSPARTARWLSRRSQAPGRKVQAEPPHHPSRRRGAHNGQLLTAAGAGSQRRVGQVGKGSPQRERRHGYCFRLLLPHRVSKQVGGAQASPAGAPAPPQASSPPSSTPGTFPAVSVQDGL